MSRTKFNDRLNSFLEAKVNFLKIVQEKLSYISSIENLKMEIVQESYTAILETRKDIKEYFEGYALFIVEIPT